MPDSEERRAYSGLGPTTHLSTYGRGVQEVEEEKPPMAAKDYLVRMFCSQWFIELLVSN